MSEKINWTPELLAECRNEKGVVLDMMSAEAQQAIQQSVDKVISVRVRGEWVPTHSDNNQRLYSSAYRLSPSYVPPELEEKKWVDVPVRKTSDDIFIYRTPLGNDKQLVSAASCISFVGYVYADGTLDTLPRQRPSNDRPAEAPVAVRFWKG